MKTRYQKTRHALLALAAILMLAGCQAAGNNLFKGGEMIEIERAAGVDDKKDMLAENAEIVPEDNIVSEDISRLHQKPGDAGTGAAYQGLSPNDPLTEMAKARRSLYPVYFDFDRYTIKDDETQTLGLNAKWLKLNSDVKVLVEGHADERGETEYNLALGDRRARSVKRFLEDTGIPDARVATISYGEEKPADQGHTEEAWAKNRRAEFMLLN